MSVAVSALLLGLCVMAGVTGTAIRIAERFRLQGGLLERFVWCASIGLAGMAYLVLAVGSAGWLRKEVFVAVLVLLLAIGARKTFLLARELAVRGIRAFRSAGWFEKILVLPVAAALFFSLAAALAPAVGQDELCYHLAQPQNFIREQAVYPVPYSINVLWPYLSHMLFTLGLLLQGAESAKLFHWIFYVLTALAVAAFVRRQSRGSGAWIAAAAYLTAPAAMTQAGYAYIDHALALYVFLAFYAAFVWAQNPSRGWAWLAGIAAGLAASVKLIGLFAVFPIAGVALIHRPKDAVRARAWTAGLARIVAGMALAGIVWYVRSWILRGNPVYPFYPSFFGGNGFEDPTYVDSHARGAGVGAFLLLPWDLTFHPDLFGGEVMGPLFLACVPVTAFWARGAAVPATLAALGAYALVWFGVDPNIRFFYAGFAWLSVLVGMGMETGRRQLPEAGKAALSVLFLALAALQAAFAPYHYADEARLFLGTADQRREYLRQNERSTPLAEQVNRFLRPEDRLLSLGEARGFYFEPHFTLGGDFERMLPAAAIPDDPGALAAFLKRAGFTHVLLASDRDAAAPLKLERIIGDRAAGRLFFKDELVVRSKGRSYVIYRIL